MTALGKRKLQPYGTPKARCEILLPLELDTKLDSLAAREGVTRTALMITAVERLVYGEERNASLDTLQERVAALAVGQERLTADLLEIRAYLDVLAQTACGGDQGKFDRFLSAVDRVKTELT